MYPQILRENYKTKGRLLKVVVDALNRLGRFANNINGVNGIDVLPNAFGGLDLSISGGRGGRWTGVVWFGNDITDFSAAENWPENVTGKYLIVDLSDGSTRFEDSLDELDNTVEQAFWVADEVLNDEDPPAVVGYRLNNHTQGDIHARIT